MKKLDIISGILLIIGGLNWGIIGAFEFNVFVAILGEIPLVIRIIYILVGLSAIYRIIECKACQKRSRK